MRNEDFEMLLDRWGADFANWPAAQAEAARHLLVWSREAQRAHATLKRVEQGLAATRPTIDAAQVERVMRRAMAAVERREANPSLLERFRRMLLAPLPRAALAMSLTAIGFAIGLAATGPTAAARFDTSAAPLMPTSADDVLF
jgi:hypothetical protein